MAPGVRRNNARSSRHHARSSRVVDEVSWGAHTRRVKIPLAAPDPLGEALHFLRMSGVMYCRSEFTAPWALELPPFEDCLMFHVVTAGRCQLEVGGGDARTVQPGEFALVPHGVGHRLTSAPGVTPAKLFDLPREQVSDRYEILRHGGGGTPSTIVCGAVRFDHPAARRLITLLPAVITIDAWTSPEQEWIQSTLRLMALEARDMRPGGETIVTRLADILVIQAIRSWMARDPAARTGWLGALQDGQIGRALALVHRDPAQPWTVASLAEQVAMSRSAFAARFTSLLGEPAMHYVARWRMHVALAWLKEDAAPLGDVASRLGYESEAAFSRAFKRFLGFPPGAVRRSSGRSLQMPQRLSK
jgi:AraC-like DNA-binding protein/mannose-6-phosphate isomerase-like protein (cupin superfamily)